MNNENDLEHAVHSDHLYQDDLNPKKPAKQHSTIYPILEYVSSTAKIIGDPADEYVENREVMKK